MGVRLKKPNGEFPPGGSTFSDPHTGMLFPGDGVDLHTQSLKVADHRRANPRIYSPDKEIHFDHKAIQGEILIQMCARNPQWCEDDARPGEAYPFVPAEPSKEIVRKQGKKCVKCGGFDFEPVYCRSCGGRKIASYKCLTCGLDQ
jgi:hypothetical protein